MQLRRHYRRTRNTIPKIKQKKTKTKTVEQQRIHLNLYYSLRACRERDKRTFSHLIDVICLDYYDCISVILLIVRSRDKLFR